MNWFKRNYFVWQARRGNFDEAQLLGLIDVYENCVSGVKDWNFELSLDCCFQIPGHSSNDEIQKILKNFFKYNPLNSIILSEIDEVKSPKTLHLFIDTINNCDRDLDNIEQKFLLNLNKQLFYGLKVQFDEEYELCLLESACEEKINSYLQKFILRPKSEIMLVDLAEAFFDDTSQPCNYSKLLQSYISYHQKDKKKAFADEDSQNILMSAVDNNEAISLLIDQCTIHHDFLKTKAIRTLVDKKNDKLLIKFLSVSCIRDEELIGHILYTNSNPQIKNMLTISGLRRFLSDMEFLSAEKLGATEKMRAFEQKVVNDIENLSSNAEKEKLFLKKIYPLIYSGSASPALITWCMLNENAFQSLYIPSMALYMQKMHTEMWRNKKADELF